MHKYLYIYIYIYIYIQIFTYILHTSFFSLSLSWVWFFISWFARMLRQLCCGGCGGQDWFGMKVAGVLVLANVTIKGANFGGLERRKNVVPIRSTFKVAPIQRSSWQQLLLSVANHVYVNRSNFLSVMQQHMQTSGRRSHHMNEFQRFGQAIKFWSMWMMHPTTVPTPVMGLRQWRSTE